MEREYKININVYIQINVFTMYLECLKLLIMDQFNNIVN